MAMDREDQRYFDDKFGLVHKRITDSQEAQTAELHRVTIDQNSEIADIKQSIESHKIDSATHPGAAVVAASDAARAAVSSHEESSWVHNVTKAWVLLAAIGAVFTAVYGFATWVAKHFK